jgi:uncharacterized protein YjdB
MINKKTRSIAIFITVIMLFSAFPAISAAAADARTQTGIDYSFSDVIVKGQIGGAENSSYFINLTNETFSVPAGYAVAAYSVNGGNNWTAVGSRSTFDNAAFARLLTSSRDTTLVLTDIYDSRARRPAANATVVSFPRINRRPRLPMYNINYVIGADPTGQTPGTWVLTDRSNNSRSVKEGIEIAAVDSTGRNPDRNGFGRFFGADGTANGIEIAPLPENNRQVSTAYIIRIGPADNGNGTFAAASESRRITVSGQPRPGTYNVSRSRRTISHGANTYVFKEGVHEEPVLLERSGTLDVSGFNGDVFLWSAERSSNPASAIQKITIESTPAVFSFSTETIAVLSDDLSDDTIPIVPADDELPHEPIPSVTFDFAEARLVFARGGLHTIDMGTVDVPAGTNVSIPIDETWFGRTLNIIKLGVPADGTNPATLNSLPFTLPVPARPAAPAGLTTTNADVAGDDGRGSIHNMQPTMQWRAITGTADLWTDFELNNTGSLPVGTYQVRLKATGSAFASQITTLAILPFDPVRVTGVTISSATNNVFAGGTLQLTANVVPANAHNRDVTWSSGDASIATVDSNGNVLGVAPGDVTITVRTVDNGRDATRTVTVVAQDTPPVITTLENLPNAFQNIRYNEFRLSATGATPITWAIHGGVFPPGMTLSNTGIISGTPTQLGVYDFTVIATNARGENTKPFKIEVERTNTVTFEVVSGIGGQLSGSIAAGTGTVEAGTASGGNLGRIYVLDGSRINFTASPEPGYQVKAWRVGVNGAEPAIVTGTADTYSRMDIMTNLLITVEFELKIRPDNLLDRNGIVGRAYSQQFSVEGAAAAYTWTARPLRTADPNEVPDGVVFNEDTFNRLPNGLTLSAAGLLSGTPTVRGTFYFAIDARIGTGPISTKIYSVRILQLYTVAFTRQLPFGVLTAQVNGTEIEPGSLVPESSNIVFTVAVDPGYRVQSWTITPDNVYLPPASPTAATYTLFDLRGDVNVVVTLTADGVQTVPITFDVAASGGGTVRATLDGVAINSGARVPINSFVEFTATPHAGHRIKEWTATNPIAEHFPQGENDFRYSLRVADPAGREVEVVFEAIPVSSIALNRSTLPIAGNDTATLTTTILPANAFNQNVTWTVTCMTTGAPCAGSCIHVTVDNGIVTGLLPGTARVTATVTGHTPVRSDSCVVTVTNVNVSSVAIAPPAATIIVGEELNLTATVTPATAINRQVTWRVASAGCTTPAACGNIALNPRGCGCIISIAEDGRITGQASGTATVTVTTVGLRANGTPATATCTVTVRFVPVLTITGVPSLAIRGQNMPLAGTVLPSDATHQDIEWEILANTINIMSGPATSVNAVDAGTGTVIVRATIKDGIAKDTDYIQNFTITVANFIAVTNITGVPAAAVARTPVNLTGTVTPANASNRTIAWSVTSAGSTGATLTGTTLNTTAAGIVEVTATIIGGDIGGAVYSQRFNITITPILATGINLNRTNLQLALGNVGNTETLVPTVLPENAADRTVTWTSSNPSVASVESNGRVTAMGVGTATITVTTNDGSGRSATCAVTVAAEPIKPSIITGSLPSGIRTVPYNITLSATGTVPIIWEEVLPSGTTASRLPGGLTLSPQGVISGTPDTVRNFTFQVRARNIVGEEIREFTIQVDPPVSVTAINLHADATILPIGGNTSVRVTIFPANATNRQVIWSTTNAGIADVDAAGVITGRSVGTVTITGRTLDGGFTATVTVNVVHPPVEGILLNKSSTTLPIAGSEVLIATVYPPNARAEDRVVTWSSSNTAVATVNNGAVIAVAAGAASITARTPGGHIAVCAVTVTVPVSGVTLNKTTTVLMAGDSETLTATVAPANATNRSVNWTTSDRNIAIVDTSGTITAVAPGSAVITATTVDGGRTATCTVTVNPRPVTGVTLNKSTTRIAVNDHETLIAATVPVNATNQNKTWNSSNTSVATVDTNGRVTGRTAGTARITVTTSEGNFTAYCEVTVHTVAVAGVTLRSSATIGIGASETLVPTFVPANATNRNVTWASSNPGVASVDSNGRVTGRAAGTATIMITTAEGRYTATCAVTVTQNIAVTGVSLNRNSLTLNQGASETLTATVSPSNALNRNVSWSSSNPGVATVDNNGRVTAVSAGSATITVTTADGGRTATCAVTVEGIFNITLNQAAGGTARVSATQARTGTAVTLSATVSDGNHVSWRVSPTNVIVTGNSFVMPNSNVTITPVYQPISLVDEYIDSAAIDTANSQTHSFRVGGSVSVPAATLADLARRNSGFALDATTAFGGYRIPVNFSSIIPGFSDTLARNNLRSDQVTFNITMSDRTSDRAVTDAFSRDMPQSRMISAVEFGTDVARLTDGGAGSTLSTVESFTERVTRLIRMPQNMTSMPHNWGVFRYNETSRRFEFVPHTTQMINGVLYAAVQSTTNGIYIVAENTAAFGDVRPGEWYTNYVEQAASKRLVQGVGGGLYDPDRNVTRAEFVQMMANALQLPAYSGNTRTYRDVQSGTWFYNAVMRARSAGLLDRFSGENFSPNQAITREEMAVILAAVARRERITSNTSSINLSQTFNDFNQMNSGYTSDIELVVRLGIMQGIGGGMFNPRGNTTRAQAATVQIRMLELLGFLG